MKNNKKMETHFYGCLETVNASAVLFGTRRARNARGETLEAPENRLYF